MNWSLSSVAIVGLVGGYLSLGNLGCSSCNCPAPGAPVESVTFDASVLEEPMDVFPLMNDAVVAIDAENETATLEYADQDGETVRVEFIKGTPSFD